MLHVCAPMNQRASYLYLIHAYKFMQSVWLLVHGVVAEVGYVVVYRAAACAVVVTWPYLFVVGSLVGSTLSPRRRLFGLYLGIPFVDLVTQSLKIFLRVLIFHSISRGFRFCHVPGMELYRTIIATVELCRVLLVMVVTLVSTNHFFACDGVPYFSGVPCFACEVKFYPTRKT